jgi:hypothetical protein
MAAELRLTRSIYKLARARPLYSASARTSLQETSVEDPNVIPIRETFLDRLVPRSILVASIEVQIIGFPVNAPARFHGLASELQPVRGEGHDADRCLRDQNEKVSQRSRAPITPRAKLRNGQLFFLPALN